MAGQAHGRENHGPRVAELERKLIDQNMGSLKIADEKEQLVQRLGEMKQKFNDLVKAKADLQQELIYSEEEKLKVTKALIELQIENATLNESIQNQTFDVNTKLLHVENELLEQNVKEERAAKAIAELQERLNEALNDRKEMEIEFIALKKNFFNLKQEVEQERQKNENLGVEVINLVNENKAVRREFGGKGEGTMPPEEAERQLDQAKAQRDDAQQEVARLRAQVEQERQKVQQLEAQQAMAPSPGPSPSALAAPAVDTAKVAQLESEVQLLRQQNESLKQQIKQLLNEKQNQSVPTEAPGSEAAGPTSGNVR